MKRKGKFCEFLQSFKLHEVSSFMYKAADMDKWWGRGERDSIRKAKV
jgi:hypothetical protein